MDRKSILVLVVSFVLLLTWYPLMYRVGVIKPAPPATNQLASATNRVTDSTNRLATSAPAPATPPPIAPQPPAGLPSIPLPTGDERMEVLENEDARFVFTSHGGGLKRIELKKYPEKVGRRPRDRTTNQDVAMLNDGAPVPALSLLGAGLQDNGDFRLSRLATGGIRAEKTLSNGLQLVKEFQLATNRLLSASVRIENATAQPIRLPAHEWVVGTATPMTPTDQTLLTGLQWFNGSKAERIGEAWFANRTLGCIPGTPRTEYVGGNHDVVWAGVHNQFFTMVAIPSTNAPQLVARSMPLPDLWGDDPAVKKGTPPVGYLAAFRYSEGYVAAQGSLEHRMQFYAGPKEYHALARLGTALGNNLDLVMEFDGFFGWFAKALLLSMNGLNRMGLSYGLAIIAITVIIKLLFWPLTNASTKSMKRMQSFQPQMKAIQDKYKDDPRKMNQKLMEFMKEHKISPLGGCLPLLLQIPVFFGFYKMLQSAIELRGATFLWASDLSQPDTVWTIPGLAFPVNPLPLIMGVTMIWQARLTPVSPGMDPVQQKIMRYMPLMFMVFLYNFSAGLTLYWTVQNLLSIAQMKLTKTDPVPAAPAAVATPARRSPTSPSKSKK